MPDRKLFLADRPKKFSIRQIERIDQIDKLPLGSQNIVQYRGGWWDLGRGHRKKTTLKGGPSKKNEGKEGIT